MVILRREMYFDGFRERPCAIGECKCGAEVPLMDQYMGACECPGCGQWYNLSGQELLPPEEWGYDGTPLEGDAELW